jgi:hypothetical protein
MKRALIVAGSAGACVPLFFRFVSVTVDSYAALLLIALSLPGLWFIPTGVKTEPLAGILFGIGTILNGFCYAVVTWFVGSYFHLFEQDGSSANGWWPSPPGD